MTVPATQDIVAFYVTGAALTFSLFDSDGTAILSGQAMTEVATGYYVAESDAVYPGCVVVITDTAVGKGVVGGYLWSDRAALEDVRDMARQILEAVSTFGPVAKYV